MEFDPHAQFGFEILFEHEVPKYVTIDELKTLIKEKPYQTSYDEVFLDFKTDPETGLKYVDIQSYIFPAWVCSHILVNTCMEDPDSYDWSRLTDMYSYQRIADYVYIRVHPYTWITKDDSRLHACLVLGKVASMVTDKGRVDMFLYDWLTRMLQERVLYLADKNPRAVADSEYEGVGKILKGMLAWNLITSDARNYLNSFMYDEMESHDIEYFHTEAFRENIQFIAQERGGKVAAELLRQLRKDWKAIVTWKCFGIDKLTPEQVETFRQCLFEGMDYYLEQWDAETPKAIESQTTKKKPAQQNRNYITFTMSGINVGHINMLRQKLIQVGWIAKDTLPDDFYKLFSGKTNSTKITWTGAVGKGMLLFLFQKMVEQGEIVVPDNHSITTILESHFVDKNGIYISGLNSSKESPKHFPVVNECLNILQLEADND